MRVTIDMIDPEFRTIARIIRLLTPLTGDFISSFNKTRSNRTLLYKGVKSKTRLWKDHIFIERPDGTKLRLLALTGDARSNNKPGILWLHGGGYGLGVPEKDIPFIERFVGAHDAFCILPEYTLSIDKPYPAALEDAYLALKWLFDNGAAYGMNINQLFIGGDSGGGGLTIATALHARDKGEIPLAFMMPLYPMIDDALSTASMKDNDAPVWDERQNRFAWQMYLGGLYGRDDVPYTAAPFRATDVRGLPPAVSFVGGVDPFCDETAIFMRRLQETGIQADFKILEGVFHAFDIGRPKSTKGAAAIAFLLEKYRYACDHCFASGK